MDFSNILGTVSLGASGAVTRAGSSGAFAVGVRNLNVRFPEATHSIWVRRVRIFGDAPGVAISLLEGTVSADTAYAAPQAQVETATAAGTITTAGNAVATVTGAGLAAAVPVTFAVTLGDTASVWAAKARAAIAANATIAAKYAVSGTGAAIVLTRIVDDYGFANDGTMNIALADGTSAGITEAATSVNTAAGAVATGALVDTEDAEDAEGVALEHYEFGLRGILVQGVRGEMEFDDGGSLKFKVAGGGAFFAAAPTDGDELVTESDELELASVAGVAEVYVVMVTASA